MGLTMLQDHAPESWEAERAARFADLGVVDLSRYAEPAPRRYDSGWSAARTPSLELLHCHGYLNAW